MKIIKHAVRLNVSFDLEKTGLIHFRDEASHKKNLWTHEINLVKLLNQLNSEVDWSFNLQKIY